MGSNITRYLQWAILLVVCIRCTSVGLQKVPDIPHMEVENWAVKFGVQIWEISKKTTRLIELQKRFNENDARVERVDGLVMMQEMARDVRNMMHFKMQAITRIMDSAEQMYLSHKYIENLKVFYYNAKPEREKDKSDEQGQLLPEQKVMGEPKVWPKLEPNPHFDGTPISTEVSSVHIPTNVYDGDAVVMNDVKWSEELNSIFKSNYDMDPTLMWQYFGSAKGFLRQFPASKWTDQEPDLYDCRVRSWYVKAAASAKDIVILLDISGSMTGIRSKIATHVVHAILDTLTDNDFVNIYTFNNATAELVPCFKDTLVQANLENIRELKNHTEFLPTTLVANVATALTTAFEVLEKFKESGRGADCNQAIMLVTDGASYNHKEIFEKYNWPHMSVRVFTYLIGREITDVRDVRWMACANRGYFVHVASQADVQEQVMKYIPVMARPIVMYQNKHPITWTQVYADIANRAQKYGRYHGYRLMTSVATPVFDRNNFTEVKVMIEGGVTSDSMQAGDIVTKQERIANLLGVAGTDVPIKEIEKLTPPYKLGVNGYSFMVTNNGYILFHRDLRPVFQDILKPNYNGVDLNEVELIDNNLDTPRTNDSTLYTLRRDMIDQKEGEWAMNVTIHYDQMKRVTTRRQQYFYRGIEETPFSLGIALPDEYGLYRIKGEVEIKLADEDVTKYFKGTNWRIHPDWVYCEYNYPGEHPFRTTEERLMHFLKKTQLPGWKWRSQRMRTPPKDNDATPLNSKKMDKDSYYCDKELIQSLVFDAKVTKDFDRKDHDYDRAEGPLGILMALLPRQGFFQMFGITLAFVATRSGITRWQDHSTWEGKDNSTEPHFSDIHNRAIDEIWYRRAVDQYGSMKEGFVVSVPFDAGMRNNSLVTATYAIFHEHNGHKAPVAVVGLQFLHSVFAETFMNITSGCTGHGDCKTTCASELIYCYVLDANGFVVISEKHEHTGRFFGEIDGTIMDSLVQDNIYKRVHVFDYQSVCMDVVSRGSDASFLMAPLHHLKWLLHWLLGNLAWLIVQTNLHMLWDFAWVEAHATSATEEGVYAESEATMTSVQYTDDMYDAMQTPYTMAQEGGPFPFLDLAYINKTRPRPCDREVDLYILQPEKLYHNREPKPLKGKLTNCHTSGCERPFSVQKIPYTNLILLVADTYCPCESKLLSITPREVHNSTSFCGKMTGSVYRKRPKYCMEYHPEEEHIKACGRGVSVVAPGAVLLVLVAIARWLPLS